MAADPTGGEQTNLGTDLGSLVSISKIMQDLKSLVTSNLDPATVMSIMGGIDVKTMEIARSFGVGQEQAQGLKSAIIASRDAVIGLGGSFKDVFDIQLAVSKELGRNVVLSIEGQKELFAASKVTNQSFENIVKSMKDVGISAYDAGDAMFKVVKAANEVGVSAQKVSEMVVKNTSYLNQFNFRDGVEGLAKMAAQATSMRIEMSEAMKVAEKAFNPEGAIKMAAELQRLGVTQSELLDPLNLMNLAENDPAELQNQLAEMSKQFVQMNEKGQFEILPGALRQLREVEKSLGMSTGTLAKMALSSAELDEKMRKIRFPEFVSEEQKKLLANLTEMKEGKMMITVDGKSMELDKALADASKEGQEGINKLLEATKPKTIEELAVNQLDVLKQINVGINLLSGVIPTAAAGTKEGERAIRTVGTTFARTGASALETFGGTANISEQLSKNIFAPLSRQIGNLNFSSIMSSMSNLNLGTLTLGETFTKLKEKIDPLVDMIGGQVGGLTSSSLTQQQMGEILNKIAEVFKIEDAIISPKLGTFKTLKEDDIYVGTGLSTMIDKLSEIKSATSVQPANLITNIPTLTTQEKVTTVESKSSPTEMKIDLNINVTAPPQIDTNQITNVLKDQLVIQQIIQKIEQVTSNNNLTKTPR